MKNKKRINNKIYEFYEYHDQYSKKSRLYWRTYREKNMSDADEFIVFKSNNITYYPIVINNEGITYKDAYEKLDIIINLTGILEADKKRLAMHIFDATKI